MFGVLKKFWHTLTTGWVVEYPSGNDTPNDFFDKRDRKRQGWKPSNDEDESKRGSRDGRE